ncbi:E3 ubiquitin-protein ligase TRIM63-like [Gigantopelta aegis]|uniref:E3 ubiquitin-protein ligase TRIM63-like n=1 Tax=Gigantopelta aegis TaxID=1735272 RepID=UPI001B888982|nr:E3 ubiquitin-protein ligase TRIM63-like [Gigantopelta aegis]
MPQEEFFQQKDMCKLHDNMKLDLFCKTCLVAVCSSCVHVSHSHEGQAISNLKDVYSDKKELLRNKLSELKTSEKRYSTHKQKLVDESKTLDDIQEVLVRDIEERGNIIVAKIKEMTQQLTEYVV